MRKALDDAIRKCMVEAAAAQSRGPPVQEQQLDPGESLALTLPASMSDATKRTSDDVADQDLEIAKIRRLHRDQHKAFEQAVAGTEAITNKIAAAGALDLINLDAEHGTYRMEG